jgi:hypothetical protein
MGCAGTYKAQSLASATLVLLLTLIGNINAAEPNLCTVSANPPGFDHRQLTLEGIVTGLTKSTSRAGRKEVVFQLESSAGCGGVTVYAQVPVTLRDGDHLQVEGTFEKERRRDGSTFHNEIQATKITILPR